MPVFLLVAILAAAGPPPIDPPAHSPKNVLIVRGESPDLPGNRIITDAIEETVRQAIGSPVEFYTETVETTRYPGDLYERRLAELIAEKHAAAPLDLVVAFSAPAVEFVRRERAALFPHTPLLFGLIDPDYFERTGLP